MRPTRRIVLLLPLVALLMAAAACRVVATDVQCQISNQQTDAPPALTIHHTSSVVVMVRPANSLDAIPPTTTERRQYSGTASYEGLAAGTYLAQIFLGNGGKLVQTYPFELPADSGLTLDFNCQR